MCCGTRNMGKELFSLGHCHLCGRTPGCFYVFSGGLFWIFTAGATAESWSPPKNGALNPVGQNGWFVENAMKTGAKAGNKIQRLRKGEPWLCLAVEVIHALHEQLSRTLGVWGCFTFSRGISHFKHVCLAFASQKFVHLECTGIPYAQDILVRHNSCLLLSTWKCWYITAMIPASIQILSCAQ